VLLFLRPFTTLGPQKELTGFDAFVQSAKPILPIPALLVVIPLLWLFFRGTWREIDEEAVRERSAMLAKGKGDPRPMVGLVLVALILTMQEYYGGRAYFEQQIFPLIAKRFTGSALTLLAKYDELFGFAWWATTRIGGYMLPFLVWKIAFRKDSILDLGLRTRGFFQHAWIYALFLAVVLPAMLVVSSQPDFGSYYPFYKNAPRSWFDFLTWEAMYFAQFFALEMFFRGFFLGVLRKSFGSGAIFAMAVPYCMIHFGKPYLEAIGAVVAGIALGSLSMKTKSIYQGFLVHITVAALMDWLSLRRRHCTPLTLWAPQTQVTCAEQAGLRDELAAKIEKGAIAVFLVVIAMAVVLIVRARRRKAALI
jgi:membrane protease YdiL (CAAX protease family)